MKIQHNDAFKLGPNAFAQYVSPPGDPRQGWRLMDKFGNGMLVEGDAIQKLLLTLSSTPLPFDESAPEHTIVPEPERIDGCDIGTVTAIAPSL